jgi:uncharacterized protein YxjI
MRYTMKERMFSFGDDYTIKDESGRDAYYVDGKVFTLREKLLFQDMAGRELAVIQKKILAIGPTYEIYRDGRVAAVVKKHLFTLFRAKFSVDVPGPDDLEAAGNFLDHEYTFSRGAREVATVSKRWFSIRDTYGIEIAPGEDDVLVLASAVVIDLCAHPDKKDGE